MNKPTIFLGSAFIAMLAAQLVQADELLGRWRFDDQQVAGNRVRPVTGSLDGTIVGEGRLSKQGPASLVLDGRTSRVTVCEDTGRLELPRQQISVEAWVRVDKPLTWGGIVSCLQDNGSYERGWLLGFRDTRFCFAISSDGTKRLTYLTAAEDFAPGAWYHVVGTYDGKKLRLFVDGRAAAESNDQSGEILYPPKTWFEIGAYHDDNEVYPLSGRIAEVAVYTRTLAGQEIKSRFDEGKQRFPGIEPQPQQPVAGWPTYMHDHSRSGLTAEKLPLPLTLAWVLHPGVDPAWPPPAKQDFWHNKYGLKARVTYDRAAHVVSDGKRVYFASSTFDRVFCVDIAQGDRVWDYYAEGPVRLAPTLHQGRVYFGSDDGRVYCLDADNGSLVWRYQAADHERRIPGNGRIISSLPVRSGLLIQGGQVRFAAGLFPSQGACQFALDADTGQLLNKGELKFSPQGYLRRQGSNLTSPAGRSPQVLLGRLTQSGKIVSPSLERAPEKYPYAYIGTADLRLAGGDGEVAILRADGGELIDRLEVKGKAYGLAVAGASLFVSTDEGCVYCFRHGGTGDDSPVEHQEASLGEIWPEPLVDSCLATAERIAAQAQDKRGYCLVYGSGDGCLAYWLARLTDFKILGIEPDADKVAQSRGALARVAREHVPIHHGRLDKLPYASAIFNLVVSESALTLPVPGSAREVMRVLKPGGGVACIGRPETAGDSAAEYGKQLVHWVGDDGQWQLNREKGVWAKFERPALANAGHWTHIYAEPGNTASSGDELVRPPFLLQWFGGPGPQDMVDRHHRSVPPLFCNGRVFIPGNDKVFALDAYNGAPLWDADIPKFRRIAAMRDTGNMAAAPDRLFVAAGDQCRVFAADTGKQVDTHDVPAGADDSPRDWGYVAVVGDRLYGSTTRPGASRGGHSRAAIDGAYSDRRPIVTSTSLFCKDWRKGGLAWQYRAAAGAILNPTITIGDGRVYFVESGNPATLAETSGRSTPDQLLAAGACLVALDAQTGRERWRRDADFRAIEHHLYLAFARQRLVAVGSRNHRADGSSKPTVWYDIHAFDAADGTPLWKQSQDNRQGAGGDHGEQDHHPAIVDDTVFVEPKAYDLATGRLIESWRFARGGHGCGTISACPGALFFRAGNPTMSDLVSGEKTRLTHVTRPGCWINIIPAGGLILIPEASSGCTCNFGVQTSLALIPASLERGNDGKVE